MDGGRVRLFLCFFPGPHVHVTNAHTLPSGHQSGILRPLKPASNNATAFQTKGEIRAGDGGSDRIWGRNRKTSCLHWHQTYLRGSSRGSVEREAFPTWAPTDGTWASGGGRPSATEEWANAPGRKWESPLHPQDSTWFMWQLSKDDNVGHRVKPQRITSVVNPRLITRAHTPATFSQNTSKDGGLSVDVENKFKSIFFFKLGTSFVSNVETFGELLNGHFCLMPAQWKFLRGFIKYRNEGKLSLSPVLLLPYHQKPTLLLNL